MKPATISDVAMHAGVSKKTVSRVINNEENVKKTTKDKVLASIDALQFKRNPLGIALAKNRSFFIALLSDNPSPGYLMKLQKGILQACTEQHMGLFLYECKYNDQNLALEIEDLVSSTLVDGLILTPPICDKTELIEMLDRRNIKYIRIGPKDTSTGQSVGFNANKSSYDMTRYLISLQHKNIAFVLGHPDQESAKKSESGFRQAFKEAKLSVNESLVVQGYYTYQSGIEAAKAILNKIPRPTAIFAANDEMAVGVLYEAQKRGLRVPEDISICGIDDISITTKVWPNLTTIHHPLTSIGYQTANLLIERLQKPINNEPAKGPSNTIINNGRLIVRDSTIKKTVPSSYE